MLRENRPLRPKTGSRPSALDTEGLMTVLTALVFAATLATLVSLASGITAMAHNGEVGHRTSEQWMVWRVVFQAAAFLAIVAALVGS